MNARRRRGTTLIELMVVMTIFLGMMAAIMSFYVSAEQANKKHEQVSEEYRAAIQATLRVETLLQYARIFEVRPNQVAYASPLSDGPVPPFKHRMPQYAPTLTTLWVDNTSGRLMLHEVGGQNWELIRLAKGQQLTFSRGPSSVRITVYGVESANRKSFSLTHDVLVETQGVL